VNLCGTKAGKDRKRYQRGKGGILGSMGHIHEKKEVMGGNIYICDFRRGNGFRECSIQDIEENYGQCQGT